MQDWSTEQRRKFSAKSLNQILPYSEEVLRTFGETIVIFGAEGVIGQQVKSLLVKEWTPQFITKYLEVTEGTDRFVVQGSVDSDISKYMNAFDPENRTKYIKQYYPTEKDLAYYKKGAVALFLETTKPTVVVNLIDMNQITKCDSEQAWINNLEVVKEMVNYCKHSGAYMIHLSTSMVFSSEKAVSEPYGNTSEPLKNRYQYQKHLAEMELLTQRPSDRGRYTIIRTGRLIGGGDMQNIIISTIRNLHKKTTFEGISDDLWSVTGYETISKYIASRLITYTSFDVNRQGFRNVCEIEHVTEDLEPTSTYDFACLVKEYMQRVNRRVSNTSILRTTSEVYYKSREFPDMPLSHAIHQYFNWMPIFQHDDTNNAITTQIFSEIPCLPNQILHAIDWYFENENFIHESDKWQVGMLDPSSGGMLRKPIMDAPIGMKNDGSDVINVIIDGQKVAEEMEKITREERAEEQEDHDEKMERLRAGSYPYSRR